MAFSIQTGLADYQVLQRGRANAAAVSVAGLCDFDGNIEVRVSGRGVGTLGKWAVAGHARGGRWFAGIKSLLAGGPYRIDFRLGIDSASVNNVLVGDLWVLAGQSNMEGIGDLDDRVDKPHPLVHSYSMNERWERAEEPLHWLNESIDSCHSGVTAVPEKAARGIAAEKTWRQGRTKGAGCGLAFAKARLADTGVPVGLIPCAHGGTSMAQWDPALKGKAGASLYGSMLRRVGVCGGRVAGVLWYQGESDANWQAVAKYSDATVRFVAAMRKDFRDPALPFLYVQIGQFFSEWQVTNWNSIQQQQLLLEKQIKHSAMAAAIDLQMDDFIHVGTEGHNRLGRRLARLARIVEGDRSILPGPRPKHAVLEGDRRVRVEFSGVNGRLVSAGLPAGFCVIGPDGNLRVDMYKVRLEGDSILLILQEVLPPGCTVQYGRGTAPYCNITDEADMAVPVFGPMPIAATRSRK